MAQNIPITEPVIGTKDGINTFFQTSATYLPSTVFIYRNGTLQLKAFVTEHGGRSFSVIDPPADYEDIYVRYLTRL